MCSTTELQPEQTDGTRTRDLKSQFVRPLGKSAFQLGNKSHSLVAGGEGTKALERASQKSFQNTGWPGHTGMTDKEFVRSSRQSAFQREKTLALRER